MTVGISDMIGYESHLAAEGANAEAPVERFGASETYPEWPLADFSWEEEQPARADRLDERGIPPEALLAPDQYVLQFGSDAAVRGLLRRLAADPFDPLRVRETLAALRNAREPVSDVAIRAAYRYGRRLSGHRAATPSPYEARETRDALGDYAEALPEWRWPGEQDQDLGLDRLAPPEAFILSAGGEDLIDALLARRAADPLVGGAIGEVVADAWEAGATPTPADLRDYAEHVRAEQADADPPREYFGPTESYTFYREALTGETDGALTPPERVLTLFGEETAAAVQARRAADPFAGTALPDVLARIAAVGDRLDLTEIGPERLSLDFSLYEPPPPLDLAADCPLFKSGIVVSPAMEAVEYTLRFPPLLAAEYAEQEITGRLRATLDDRGADVGAEVTARRQFPKGMPVPDWTDFAPAPVAGAAGAGMPLPPGSAADQDTGQDNEGLREMFGLRPAFVPHLRGRRGVAPPVADLLDLLEWLLPAIRNTWGVSFDKHAHLDADAGVDPEDMTEAKNTVGSGDDPGAEV